MKPSSLFLALILVGAPAFAALPPPTPEQQATAEAAKAKAAAAKEVQAALLVKAQDRTVENYKRNHHAGAAAPAPATH